MNTMTSLELSKKLYEGGCKIKSEYYQFELKDGQTFIDKLDKKRLEWLRMYHKGKWKSYPAYDLLWDVCVKHARQFFGEDAKEGLDYCPECGIFISGYKSHALRIYNLVNNNKKQEAENYLWANCLFNKENQ